MKTPGQESSLSFPSSQAHVNPQQKEEANSEHFPSPCPITKAPTAHLSGGLVPLFLAGVLGAAGCPGPLFAASCPTCSKQASLTTSSAFASSEVHLIWANPWGVASEQTGAINTRLWAQLFVAFLCIGFSLVSVSRLVDHLHVPSWADFLKTICSSLAGGVEKPTCYGCTGAESLSCISATEPALLRSPKDGMRQSRRTRFASIHNHPAPSSFDRKEIFRRTQGHC